MLRNAKWAFEKHISFTYLLLYERRKPKDFENKRSQQPLLCFLLIYSK